jgi:RNA polymerase sigma-70 factor (ECF subfamily)
MADRKSLRGEERLDDKSFERVFREYFTPLMKFSIKILQNEDDAREVVHQVFVNLWERRDETDLSRSLKSYLFTAVHNRSLNVIRDRKKFSNEEIPEQSGQWDVSEQIEAMELEQRIVKSLEELPEKCRQVFEMIRFQGLKYHEVAAQLNISVKTVENQMSKALKLLREKLMKYLTLLLWLLMGTLN